MTIEAMDHFTVLTADLAATQDFYETILGLRVGWRPPFDFPGLWLYAGKKPILHVIAGRALPQPPAGVIDHMAFAGKGLREVARKLSERGIPYELGRQRESRVWQLFVYDPNGAKVELDFASEEESPEPEAAG